MKKSTKLEKLDNLENAPANKLVTSGLVPDIIGALNMIVNLTRVVKYQKIMSVLEKSIVRINMYR